MEKQPPWRVLPHGPIVELAENLWMVEGTVPGMPLARHMTIARRSDGSLVVHNAMPLDEAAMQQVESQGPIGVILVPSRFHRLDAAPFHARYPSAKILCPRGAVGPVSKVVSVDGTYDQLPTDPRVTLEHIDGVGEREGVMKVRSADGLSLVFNDLVFDQPKLPGSFGFVYHHIVRSSGGPKVPFLSRLVIVKNKRACRDHLLRLSGEPDLKRVLVMHGHSHLTDAAQFLRTVAETL